LAWKVLFAQFKLRDSYMNFKGWGRVGLESIICTICDIGFGEHLRISAKIEKKWNVISKLAKQLLSEDEVHISAGTISNYKKLKNRFLELKDKEISETDLQEFENTIDALYPELLKGADNRTYWEKQMDEANKE